MSDIEHLIISVESYPCLWDTNHEDYHNRDIKELAWQAIAKDIYSDYESYNGIKKTSTCNNLKKKWTYIRDYYRKDQQRINNTPSGSGAKIEKKPYIYAPFLEFLKSTFKRRQSQGNYGNSNSDTQNEPDDMESSLLNQSPDTEASQQQNEDAILEAPVATSSQTSTTTIVTKTKKNIPEKILSILERRGASQPPSTNAPIEDDDVKFLLSFRGDMKRMTTSEKLDFKIEMLQLVKRIINSESPYSRPSTAANCSNLGSYYSSPSPSPNSYTQAPTSSLLRRINYRESPYSRPSKASNCSNPRTYYSSPSPSPSSSVQAPLSSLNTGSKNQPIFIQQSHNHLNIAEENSVMDNNNHVFKSMDNSQVLVLSQESLNNSQVVVLNSQESFDNSQMVEPIEKYISFK